MTRAAIDGGESSTSHAWSAGVQHTPWWLVIANVEWIISGPNQASGGRTRGAVVPGIRALIVFEAAFAQGRHDFVSA